MPWKCFTVLFDCQTPFLLHCYSTSIFLWDNLINKTFQILTNHNHLRCTRIEPRISIGHWLNPRLPVRMSRTAKWSLINHLQNPNQSATTHLLYSWHWFRKGSVSCPRRHRPHNPCGHRTDWIAGCTHLNCTWTHWKHRSLLLLTVNTCQCTLHAFVAFTGRQIRKIMRLAV